MSAQWADRHRPAKSHTARTLARFAWSPYGACVLFWVAFIAALIWLT